MTRRRGVTHEGGMTQMGHHIILILHNHLSSDENDYGTTTGSSRAPNHLKKVTQGQTIILFLSGGA